MILTTPVLSPTAAGSITKLAGPRSSPESCKFPPISTLSTGLVIPNPTKYDSLPLIQFVLPTPIANWVFSVGAATFVLYPIETWSLAVELAPAETPRKVFLHPLIFAEPARGPTKVFWHPVVLLHPARRPTKTLQFPVVLSHPAEVPPKKLSVESVLLYPAHKPMKTLQLPESLFCPAPVPKKLL